MAPFNPLPCGVEGCDYRTPSEANEDYKDQVDHWSSHFQAAHPFIVLALHFKTDALVDLIRLDRIKTPEDIITYVNAEQRQGIKRPRSKSRERSQSCSGSILEGCGENRQTVCEGEEKTRLRTRSRSRAVRIRLEDVEPEPIRETSAVFEEEPSTETPRPSSAATRWPFFCKYCGE